MCVRSMCRCCAAALLLIASEDDACESNSTRDASAAHQRTRAGSTGPSSISVNAGSMHPSAVAQAWEAVDSALMVGAPPDLVEPLISALNAEAVAAKLPLAGVLARLSKHSLQGTSFPGRGSSQRMSAARAVRAAAYACTCGTCSGAFRHTQRAIPARRAGRARAALRSYRSSRNGLIVSCLQSARTGRSGRSQRARPKCDHGASHRRLTLRDFGMTTGKQTGP